jgi:phosphopantetheinyl transferase
VVWIAETLGEADYVRLAGILDEGEIARAERIRRPPDRCAFLSGRILTRMALSDWMDQEIHPRAWRLAEDGFGKPYVISPLPASQFNISHAGGAVVVGIDSLPIGVDIETLDWLDAEDIPISVLSTGERALLERHPPELRGRVFLRLWTLKEALAKQDGEGIALDFSTLDVSCRLEGRTGMVDSGRVSLETRTVRIGNTAYQVSVARSGAQHSPIAPFHFRSVRLLGADGKSAEFSALLA